MKSPASHTPLTLADAADADATIARALDGAPAIRTLDALLEHAVASFLQASTPMACEAAAELLDACRATGALVAKTDAGERLFRAATGCVRTCAACAPDASRRAAAFLLAWPDLPTAWRVAMGFCVPADRADKSTYPMIDVPGTDAPSPGVAGRHTP